jgi:hypothetical protein
MDQAAEALAAANSLPEGNDAPVLPDGQGNLTGFDPLVANQPQVAEPPVQGDPSQGQVPPVTPDQGLPASREIDINSLPQEARDWLSAREREMQAVMTQRTQEAAQIRQQAEQSIAFLNELSTNPYFQQQVVSELTNALQQQGFSPAQASAEANRQIGQAVQANQPDEFGAEYDDDPYLREITQLRSEQEQLKQYLAQQEQASRAERLDAYYDRQLAEVRSANPNWNDDDLKRVISLGYASGDLHQAAREYQDLQQAIVERYTAGKAQVPAALNQPTAGTIGTQAPESFKGIDDPRLEQAATRMLAEALASRE